MHPCKGKIPSKKKKTEFLELLDELKDIDVGDMHVGNIKLKKSTLTPQGPVYETLHEVSLYDYYFQSVS
ncbi:MAG: hypothetical protein R2741_12460 [Methanolobus sp.]